MSAVYWAAADSMAMIGRSVRHSVRSLDALITAALLPVMILLLFVYVFGGALDGGGRYIDYVVPGIVLLCAGFGSAATAVAVNDDMTTGVIDRFRSLPIAASSVLTGHVVASVLRNLASTAIVLAVALVMGFDPGGSVGDWLVVLVVLVAFMSAISWLAACFGLLARSAEGANAFAFFVMFAPYLSSAFVDPSTMPSGLQWAAEHQPITPIADTLRALMTGQGGSETVTALAWCAGGIAVGCTAAAVLFRRRTAP